MSAIIEKSLEHLSFVWSEGVLKEKNNLCNFLPVVEDCYKDVSTG